VSDLDALARTLIGHIDEYCTSLHRAIEGAQEARAGLGASRIEASCAAVDSTHVWLCRGLDLWEEMMDVYHDNGVTPAHG
jgi:hypothetical protein